MLIHSSVQIIRMAWSIIFASIKETTDDEAESSKKREQNNIDIAKAKQAGTENLDGGGILATQEVTDVPNATETVDEKTLKQQAFEKVFRMLGSWIELVLADATEYANEHEPRPKEVIDELQKLKTIDQVEPASDPVTMFASKIWPFLKTRGWKTSMITAGNLAGRSQYIFRDKSVRYFRSRKNFVPHHFSAF